MIDKVKSIRRQLANDCATTIIRADQPGDLPPLPYATYKIIGDRKGTGQEDVTYVSKTDSLVGTRVEERNTTISFNTYGITHDNAFEVSEKLRKWFVHGGSIYMDEMDVAIADVSDTQNRTTFLVDAYDEKWGFDVIMRYVDIDVHDVDYFDKIELEMKVGG